MTASVRISLPHRLDEDGLHSVMAQAVDRDGTPRHQSCVVDFGRLRFIVPAGVTALANLLKWFQQRGVRFSFTAHEHYGEAIRYLDDSGFFAMFAGQPLQARARPRETTVPLKMVEHAESYLWLERDFIAWITEAVSLPRQAFVDVKTCLQELFHNIRDHSGQSVGCTYMQFYPQEKRIRIALADFGIGMARSVRKVLPQLADEQAIRKAFEEGFSTRSTARNRGAGLDLLVRNVVQLNGGRISIHANGGSVQCRSSGGRPDYILRREYAHYPGTLVALEFRTEALHFDPSSFEEDLEW